MLFTVGKSILKKIFQNRQDPHQNLTDEVDIQQLAWMSVPLKSYFTFQSKHARCLTVVNEFFWNSVDNHNRSCERFIGRISRSLNDKKVRDFRSREEMDNTDLRIRGYISYGSK